MGALRPMTRRPAWARKSWLYAAVLALLVAAVVVLTVTGTTSTPPAGEGVTLLEAVDGPLMTRPARRG